MINNIIDPVTGGGSANRTIQVAEAIVKYYGTECVILSTDKGLDKNFASQKDKLIIELLPCLNERFYIPYLSQASCIKTVKSLAVCLKEHQTFQTVA